MSSKTKLTAGSLAGLLAGVFILGGSSNALAVIGVGDSPLFSLNTQWATAVDDGFDLPHADFLGGCHPNPFNPVTTIHFDLAGATAVDLRIYDLQGRLVRVLVAGEIQEAGRRKATWDGRDERGAMVAAGVYLYRLVTENYVGSRRMTLVK